MIIDGYCTLGIDREYDLDAEQLIEALDRASVDRAVIAPVDRFLAVKNREGNDFILDNAKKHKDYFIPSCSVNPWYGEDAENELIRSVSLGARLLVLHPLIQGYQANDELVWPVLDVALQEKVPVYIHTGPPGNATPWQVVDLAIRYPDLDIIMGHCGATDFWNDVIHASKEAENIYLEASLARPFAFAKYLDSLGKSRGIMGSYAPLNDLCFEWEQMRKVVPQEDGSGAYGNNLKQLLEKRGEL